MMPSASSMRPISGPDVLVPVIKPFVFARIADPTSGGPSLRPDVYREMEQVLQRGQLFLGSPRATSSPLLVAQPAMPTV